MAPPQAKRGRRAPREMREGSLDFVAMLFVRRMHKYERQNRACYE
jgi:hypothetical protein